MSTGLKTFLIILIIIVFGAIGYFLLGGDGLPGGTLSSPLSTSTGQPVSGVSQQSAPDIDADQIGQEFLAQLLNIRSIKLREDVFSSPVFTSLVDFTIELVQPGNEGRQNPFAPFGVADTAVSDPFMGGSEAIGPVIRGSDTPAAVAPGPGSVTPIMPPDSEPASGQQEIDADMNNS